MGKTNPTFRDLMEGRIDDLDGYRRTLKYRDQEHFDQVVTDARNTADAAGVANLSDPWNAMLLGVCVQQQRRIAALEKEIKNDG